MTDEQKRIQRELKRIIEDQETSLNKEELIDMVIGIHDVMSMFQAYTSALFAIVCHAEKIACLRDPRHPRLMLNIASKYTEGKFEEAYMMLNRVVKEIMDEEVATTPSAPKEPEVPIAKSKYLDALHDVASAAFEGEKDEPTDTEN